MRRSAGRRTTTTHGSLDNRITIANSQFDAPYTKALIADFEKYQLPLIDGTAETRLPGARTTTFAVTNVDSSPWWKKQADKQGFAARSVFYAFTCDEPESPKGKATRDQQWQACRDEVDHVHRDGNWPGLPNVVTGSIQDVENAGSRSYTDVIAPVVDQMDGKPGDEIHGRDGMRYTGNQRREYDTFLKQPGNPEVWLYTSCNASGCAGKNENNKDLEGWVDYTIDAAASQSRAMGWLAYQYDVTGELYYAVDQNLTNAWKKASEIP